MTTIDTPHAPPPAAAEVRIDVLKGDRCCVKCGFNLHGQTIVREPHYAMLIVRCPECGTGAALQEYPSLSRMAWRVRMLLAAGWLAATLLGLFFTGLLQALYSEGTTWFVLSPYQNSADSAYAEWAKQNPTSANNTNWWVGGSQVEKWWDALPPDKFFADFGGWANLHWGGLFMWIFVAATLVPIGVVWSVAFTRLRGIRLAGALQIPTLGVALIYALGRLKWAGPTYYYAAHQLVELQVGWLPTLLTIAFGGLCLILGGWIGRPIARAFLRFVLPARLLAAFSFLWIVDGKPLPRPVPLHPPRG